MISLFTHGTNISVDPTTGPASSYTVTADLPEDNIPTDTLISLSLSSTGSLGITDIAGNPFTPSDTTIPDAESYTLNTDNDLCCNDDYPTRCRCPIARIED